MIRVVAGLWRNNLSLSLLLPPPSLSLSLSLSLSISLSFFTLIFRFLSLRIFHTYLYSPFLPVPFLRDRQKPSLHNILFLTFATSHFSPSSQPSDCMQRSSHSALFLVESSKPTVILLKPSVIETHLNEKDSDRLQADEPRDNVNVASYRINDVCFVRTRIVNSISNACECYDNIRCSEYDNIAKWSYELTIRLTIQHLNLVERTEFWKKTWNSLVFRVKSNDFYRMRSTSAAQWKFTCPLSVRVSIRDSNVLIRPLIKLGFQLALELSADLRSRHVLQKILFSLA